MRIEGLEGCVLRVPVPATGGLDRARARARMQSSWWSGVNHAKLKSCVANVVPGLRACGAWVKSLKCKVRV